MKKVGIILAVFIFLASLSLMAMADVNVAVKVKPNPKLIMELQSDPTVSAGSLDPETTWTQANAIQIRVKSNKPYTYSYTATDFSDGINTFSISNLEYDDGSGYTAYSNSGTLGNNEPRGVNNYSYDLRLVVPWDAVPDTTYTANITYSAVQN